MASPVTLQDLFIAGVRRDAARDAMPKGSLWWAEDMLPVLSYAGQSARLRERGGYAYFSNDISATVATSQYVIGGIVAPYAAGTCGVLIDEDGRAIKLTMSDGSLTDVAAANTVSANPSFHRDMVIVPGSTVKKITNAAGTLSVASLSGSPPASTYSATWNDRTLLARGTSSNKNRLWFGGLGDPESWNTTTGYWDFSFDITGIAPLKRAILVFHESYVSRLIGGTPPPGGDMFADDPLWTVGCTDARSIAYWGDRIIFASPEGIYITDGSGVDDVTVKAGMQSWWQETMAAYTTSWTIVGGVLRDFYFLSVLDGTTEKAGAMIDLRRMAWWPTTNIDMRSAFVGQGLADELYFGVRGAPRVGKLSTVFMPSSTVKNDGDGTAVTGLVETPFYDTEGAKLALRRLGLDHYLRDYATDNPSVTAAYVTSPEATSYTNLTGTITENSARDRRLIPLGFHSRGVGFKFTRANAGDWQLARIIADAHSLERSR